jgi:integrase
MDHASVGFGVVARSVRARASRLDRRVFVRNPNCRIRQKVFNGSGVLRRLARHCSADSAVLKNKPRRSTRTSRNNRPIKVLLLERQRHTRALIRGATRTLARVFELSGVVGAHAHRFRHTLATALLEKGWTTEDVSDVLGSTPEIIRKHYAQWTVQRQECVSSLAQDMWSVGFCQTRKTRL